MKKLIATIAAAFTVSTAAAQIQTAADTITSVKNVHRLTITESAEGMKVIIEGAGDNPTFRSTTSERFQESAVRSHHPYSALQSRDPGSTINFIDNVTVLAGMISAPGDGKTDIEMSKSFELAVPELIGINIGRRRSASSLSVSMGFGWRNYRTTKGNAMIPDENNDIRISDMKSDGQLKFSRLKIFSLSFPIMYRWRTPIKLMRKRMSVRAGGVLNWNCHASLKTAMINNEGNTINISTNNPGHRKFSVDILGTIDLTPFMGVYCRYCPTPILRKEHGPQFRSFSTGLVFTL